MFNWPLIVYISREFPASYYRKLHRNTREWHMYIGNEFRHVFVMEEKYSLISKVRACIFLNFVDFNICVRYYLDDHHSVF